MKIVNRRYCVLTQIELKAAEIRVETVSKLLGDIEASARDIMTRNAWIFGGGTVAGFVAVAAGGPIGFAATGIVVSSLPLLHSYFVLSHTIEVPAIHSTVKTLTDVSLTIDCRSNLALLVCRQ